VDIRFLTTFLEVAETRHFGRAAENLYLTQSAVSARIKLLEEYFNTALFIRNRNSIQITPAGEKLIPFAQELSDVLARTRKSLAEEECQHISCASTHNAFLLCFSQLLPNVMSHFNTVSFRHEIATIEYITRQLHEHSVDFALTTSLVKSDDIESTLLFEVELCAYQSKAEQAGFALGEAKTTSEGVHDINIEWSNSISEKLAKLYPELRKAKLRTSSVDVALTMAKAESSRLILPVKTHPFIDLKLKSSLLEFEASVLDDEVCVPVYLNQLKRQKNAGVEDITHFLKSAVTLK
jgi:DNA-binding transcriptional LysR family regulator